MKHINTEYEANSLVLSLVLIAVLVVTIITVIATGTDPSTGYSGSKENKVLPSPNYRTFPSHNDSSPIHRGGLRLYPY